MHHMGELPNLYKINVSLPTLTRGPIAMAKSLKSLGASLALVSAVVMASFGAHAADAKVLNIYNWSDYIAEDTIKNF